MSVFEGKTALIIEDDANSIRVLEQLLTQVDMPSAVIHDSNAVIQELDEVVVPDVIFLDLEMPSSNGYTICEYIRQKSRFDDVPVIAYTTHISHLNDARQAGFDGFMGKPIDGRQFPVYLTKILNGEAVWEIPE